MADFAFGQGLSQGTQARMADLEQQNSQRKMEIEGEELKLKAGALEVQKQAAKQKMMEEGFKNSVATMKSLHETAQNLPAIKPGGSFDKMLDTQKEIVAKFAEMTGQDPMMAQVMIDNIRASAGQGIKRPEAKVVGNQLVQPDAEGGGARVLHTAPREPQRPTDLMQEAEFAFPGDRNAQRKLVGDARTKTAGSEETPLMKEARALHPDDPEGQKKFVTEARLRPGIMVENRGESAADVKEGNVLGEEGGEVIKERTRARLSIERIGVMKQLAEQFKAQGGQFGSMAGTRIEASKLLQSVGMKPSDFGLADNVDAGEAIQAMTNEMVLGKIGGQGGMPANQFSEADRNFVFATNANIENTERGFQTKLAIAARIAQRKMEAADIYEEARANKMPVREALAEVNKRLKDKPVFTEEERQAISGIAKPQEKKVDFSKMSRKELLNFDVKTLSKDQIPAFKAALSGSK